MAIKINCVDIGARIRREVEAQHWTYSDFARAINCSRSSLYNIFNSSDINLRRLLLISKVLNVDFVGETYCIDCDDADQIKNAGPYISIPIIDGGFDLSNVPVSLIKLLKSKIDTDPRLSSESG